MKLIDKPDIGRKLGLLALISLSGMMLILYLFHQAFVNSLYQEKKLQSQRLSDTGMGVIRFFYELSREGAVSDTEARQLAQRALQSATYGDDGYFWINDGDGILVMQPYTPELVGSPRLDTTDIRGKYLFRDFVRTAREGGGWVEYYWPKPDNDAAYRKVSYVAWFEPWRWVLGTGLYLDDMEREISLNAWRAAGVILVAFTLLSLLSILLARRFMGQLRQLAVRDQLTGLHSRRFLYEALEDLLPSGRTECRVEFSVIFLDVDHFKHVNDRYGHSSGDRVLKEVSRTIRAVTRPEDLCVRYGGEEFVVVVRSADAMSVAVLAERIRVAVSKLVLTGKGKNSFGVTLSAGVARHQPGESFDRTLNRADQNLYRAKQGGRNSVVSDPHQSPKLTARSDGCTPAVFRLRNDD